MVYPNTSDYCAVFVFPLVALFGMDGIDGDDHNAHFIQSDDDESTDGQWDL